MANVIRLPALVRVGAITFRVQRNERIQHDHNLGNSRMAERLIELTPAMDSETTAITFLHELIHCISYDRHLDDALTEAVVDSLSNGLAAALQDLGWMPASMKLQDDT